jgi:hypothetical protein
MRPWKSVAASTPREPIERMNRRTLLTLVLLAGAAAALVLRVPEVVLEPRFWAEEARVYFVYALNNPAGSALLAPHQGYYSLVPNLATWLATLVPLETAPAVTTAAALLVQFVPVLIVATSTAAWSRDPGRLIVTVLVVLLVGAAGELHATTTNSQFHLALAAAVIFVEFTSDQPPMRRTLLILVLVLGGITGVQATLLAPVFAWRWWRDRQRQDAAATVALGACLVLQIAVVMAVSGEADRFAAPGDIAKALLGSLEDLAKGLLIYPIAGGLGPKYLKLPFGVAFLVLGTLGVAAAAVTQIAILRRGPGRDLIAAAWLIAIVSFIGSRRMAGGDRYLEASSVLIVLAIAVVAFDTGRNRLVRTAAGTAVLIAIVMNGWLYGVRTSDVYDPGWPVWRQEVSAWRAGERAEPRIHPQWADGVWTVPLPERLRTP